MKKFIQSLFSVDNDIACFTIGKPKNLTGSDANGDGFAHFDLTTNNDAVLTELDITAYKVAYFESEKAAKTNKAAAFENPAGYYNMNPYTEEIFVRVSPKNNPSQYAVASFTVTAATAEKNAYDLVF